LPAVPLLVSADRELVLLAISNLIGNALKYTPAGGRITLRLAADADAGGKVVFSVENTGSGLNRDELARVFESFYRTETGKASAEGFGMGLKISQEILLAHGSRLTVSSEHGKSVKFSFPLNAADGETPRGS
jgi:signal transduction histidine kinase